MVTLVSHVCLFGLFGPPFPYPYYVLLNPHTVVNGRISEPILRSASLFISCVYVSNTLLPKFDSRQRPNSPVSVGRIVLFGKGVYDGTLKTLFNHDLWQFIGGPARLAGGRFSYSESGDIDYSSLTE